MKFWSKWKNIHSFKNSFENIDQKMAAILYRSHCVNLMHILSSSIFTGASKQCQNDILTVDSQLDIKSQMSEPLKSWAIWLYNHRATDSSSDNHEVLHLPVRQGNINGKPWHRPRKADFVCSTGDKLMVPDFMTNYISIAIFGCRQSLTHWGRDKMDATSQLHRRHFQVHFLEWKYMNFD